NSALPTYPARTRFAPSPTGYLHLGSLRTALFNYLLAKRTGGQFLLRIEDTDQKRTVPDAEQRLLKDLRWAGLEWDEGPEVGGPYGPYKQSERTAIYKEHAHRLLESGHAYRCFCSAERLNLLAEYKHKLGLPTDYDRTCASIAAAEAEDRAHRGDAHTIRLKVPDTYASYHDLIYGKFQPLKRSAHTTESSFEDPILLKSDGLPTYHLANVVDDHLMKITHVIRGNEWMPSTPKHIAMYTAFGWTPPEFAHVGLLVDRAGAKLSKRNFDTDITAFKDMEILPEALTNFAALLGWSHREPSDVMDLAALTRNFTLKFTKGNTIVTFDKLHFLQRKHAAAVPLDALVAAVANALTAPSSPYTAWKTLVAPENLNAYIRAIIAADADAYSTATDFLARNAFFFTPLAPSPPPTSPDAPPIRAHVLADVPASKWDKENLKAKIQEMVEERRAQVPGSKGREVYKYLRGATTGMDKGMGVYDVFVLLGRGEVLRRLGV
ncbi:glutamyl-tRNA synthetase, partial [Pyrenochaeta sp. DS3sAY3a]